MVLRSDISRRGVFPFQWDVPIIEEVDVYFIGKTGGSRAPNRSEEGGRLHREELATSSKISPGREMVASSIGRRVEDFCLSDTRWGRNRGSVRLVQSRARKQVTRRSTQSGSVVVRIKDFCALFSLNSRRSQS